MNIVRFAHPTEAENNGIWIKKFLKIKGDEMGDKGKRDKGKREEQKKSKQTPKEKRNQKKDKKKSIWAIGRS